MRKLLVSDLDGTILPRTAHEIPTAVQNAIEKCVQNGADFCVCSGRSYADLKHFFRHFSVPVYYIGCDGALLVYNDTVLYSRPIKPPLPPHLSNQNLLAYSDYLVYAADKNIPFYRAAMKNHNGHVLPLSDKKDNPIYKLALLNAPLHACPHLSEVCRKNGWQEFVENGVSKGNTVKKLQEILHYTANETIVFGDGENDISMAQCGKSYVIGSEFFGCEKHFSNRAPTFLSALAQSTELK